MSRHGLNLIHEWICTIRSKKKKQEEKYRRPDDTDRQINGQKQT